MISFNCDVRFTPESGHWDRSSMKYALEDGQFQAGVASPLSQAGGSLAFAGTAGINGPRRGLRRECTGAF
jgi:hypothetical protein